MLLCFCFLFLCSLFFLLGCIQCEYAAKLRMLSWSLRQSKTEYLLLNITLSLLGNFAFTDIKSRYFNNLALLATSCQSKTYWLFNQPGKKDIITKVSWLSRVFPPLKLDARQFCLDALRIGSWPEGTFMLPAGIILSLSSLTKQFKVTRNKCLSTDLCLWDLEGSSRRSGGGVGGNSLL